jgi:F-type H+-transporting ATPase subunit b
MNLNATLFAQALVFFLFIFVTVKYVWPLMQEQIDLRQKTIAEGLAAAEQGKKSLEVSIREAEQSVKQGRDRAGEIIAQAEKRAAQVIEEARAAAKAEGDREKAAAAADIQQAVSRAREQLREQVAALAVSGAEKILRREVDVKTHADLLDGIKRQL